MEFKPHLIFSIITAEKRENKSTHDVEWWIPVVAVVASLAVLAVLIAVAVVLVRKYRERKNPHRRKHERIEMIDITNGTNHVTSDLTFSQRGDGMRQVNSHSNLYTN